MNVTPIQLINGEIDFTQYRHIDIVFQDLSINSKFFTKRYYVWHDGSSYMDGYITYANNSIYVVKFTITFHNGLIDIKDAYYSNIASDEIVSCTAPSIQAILGHK